MEEELFEARRVAAELSRGMAEALVVLHDTVAMIVELADNITSVVAGRPYRFPVLERLLRTGHEGGEIDLEEIE